MHDVGVATDSPNSQRSEVDGVDRTAAFLVEPRVPASDAYRVWQAIALHTSPGIARHAVPC
ncbi:hypothetical protein ACFQ2Y_00245 [Streptomyces malaysiensis subsp. malaysiensis]